MNQITKVFKDIDTDMRKARVYAINRSMTSAIAQTAKGIRADYQIRASELKSKKIITTIKARRSRPEGRAIIKEVPIPKSKFGRPTGTKRPRKYNTGKVGGTKVTVKRGNREFIKHAFVQTMPSTGHVGIFIRVKQKENKPQKGEIIQLFGPSGLMLYETPEAKETMEQQYIYAYKKNLDKGMKYYLK